MLLRKITYIARNTRSQIIPAVVDENGCVAPEKK